MKLQKLFDGCLISRGWSLSGARCRPCFLRPSPLLNSMAWEESLCNTLFSNYFYYSSIIHPFFFHYYPSIIYPFAIHFITPLFVHYNSIQHSLFIHHWSQWHEKRACIINYYIKNAFHIWLSSNVRALGFFECLTESAFMGQRLCGDVLHKSHFIPFKVFFTLVPPVPLCLALGFFLCGSAVVRRCVT